MSVEWLRESANTIAAICAVIAVVECAADGGAQDGGLRMVCGAVAAAAILQMALGCFRRLF